MGLGDTEFFRDVPRRLFEWLVTQQVIPVSPVRVRPRPETARRLPFLFDPPLARLESPDVVEIQ